MKKQSVRTMVAGLGLILSVGQAIAGKVEITVRDPNTPTVGTNAQKGIFDVTSRLLTDGLGTFQEDGEAEPGSTLSQVWDMEAFVVDDVAKKLYIVSGYNLLNGEASTLGAALGNTDGQLSPGDLFIKVGGNTPSFMPITPGYGTILNGTEANNTAGTGYNYSYAIDLSKPTFSPLNVGFGATAQLYQLNATSRLNTAVWDEFGANPWKYDNSSNSAAALFGVAITYTTGLSNNAVNGLLGFNPLVNGLKGGLHNVLTVDLNFISALPNTPIYFSYTMECGNDSLKGYRHGGFDRVSDSASSVLLMILGMAALSASRLKRRAA